MSVPEEKRKESKLTVILKALQLAEYTNDILANEKKFDPAFREILGNKIADMAQKIYINCRLANGTRVTKPVTNEIVPRNKARRVKYQDEAIELCEVLEGYIEMAHKNYHMPAKRAAYWTRLTAETKMFIKKWQVADKKRYDSS